MKRILRCKNKKLLKKIINIKKILILLYVKIY